MQYQGGKSRVAKEISEVILTYMVGGVQPIEIPRWKVGNSKEYFKRNTPACGGGQTRS